MDLATLVGFILGMLVVLGSILMGGSLVAFIDIPSMVVVGGGTMAAILVNYPLTRVKMVIQVVKNSFVTKLPDEREEIERIIRYAQVARREGLLALEEKLPEIDDPFLVKGVQLVIDGFPAETVRDILSIEMDFQRARHAEGKEMLEQFAAFAPAFGMIGTLMGLVQMLQNLSNPDDIGSGMAVALLTTFYGAVLANLLFTPMAGKLAFRDKEEMLLREIMIEGVIAIQSGDKPQLIREKLKSFIAPPGRAALEKKN